MAGHSKWANIKHRKEKADAAKGKLFSRITKEIISAVKQGGPDPKSNTKLRIAIQKAKAVNLPNENIERNIKKASSSDQADYVPVTYEIYAHGGVGIIVEALTDNKNRTVSDLRIATNKKGGTVANPGSVAFNFDKKGVIQIAKKDAIEEELFMAASESGADDFDVSEDCYFLITAPEKLYDVKEKIESLGFKVLEGNLEMIPKSYVSCSSEDAKANFELIEWIEALEDIDSVYHNMKTSD